MLIRQSSLSGGELGPQLLGKTDQERYASALRLQRNAWTTKYGSVENRSGTQFIGTPKAPNNIPRFVKFVFGLGIGYLLVVENNCIRIYKGGAAISVVGSSTWNSGVTYVQGVVVLSAGIYYYSMQNGNVANTPVSSPTWWYAQPVINGIASLEIPATFPQGALAQMQYVQQNSIMTFAHQLMHPQQLTRTSDTQWAITQLAVNNTALPTGLTLHIGNPPASSLATPAGFITSGGTGATVLYYIVAYTNSPSAISPYAAASGLTSSGAHPITLTWTAVAGVDGYAVYRAGGLMALVPQATTTFVDNGVIESTAIAVPPPGGGTNTLWSYVITAVDSQGNESLATAPVQGVGGTPSGSAPNVLSWTASGSTQQLNFTSVSNGAYITLTNPTTGTASVSGTFVGTLVLQMGFDGVNWTTVQTVTAPTATPIAISIPALYRWICTAYTSGTATTTITTSPAVSYNVYISVPWNQGLYGFIGSSDATTFNDTYIQPDIAHQPPVAIPLFQTSDDWPAVVAQYQQRLCFANTINQPQTIWMSAIGLDMQFTTTLPEIDSQAVQATIQGRTLQYIQALVDMGILIVHTSAGEYKMTGNQFNAITPAATNPVQQGAAGSQLIVPVQIGPTDLFVQARGNIIRDLQYSIYTTTYTGKDCTIYSPQIFLNTTITQMDWQQIQHSIVWCLLANGQLAGMTYSRDENIWGWHHHDTFGGSFQQVCVIPENTLDSVYVLVQRKILGSTMLYIERMANRDFQDTQLLNDAVFTDCSFTYNGANTNLSFKADLSTSGGWTPQDNITVDIGIANFNSSSIGTQIVIRQLADGSQLIPTEDGNGIPYAVGYVLDEVRITIISVTSSTEVVGNPTKSVPAWAQAGVATWGYAINSFTGYTQLAGMAISGLADGNVVMNAITDANPTVVSSGGAFTLPNGYCAMNLTFGLPITCQLQTLPIGQNRNIPDTAIGKQMVVDEVVPVFYNSRAVYTGQDSQHLYPWVQYGIQVTPMGAPVPLFTGPYIIPIQGTWDNAGGVFLQQVDPLPLGLSAIVSTVTVGD